MPKPWPVQRRVGWMALLGLLAVLASAACVVGLRFGWPRLSGRLMRPAAIIVPASQSREIFVLQAEQADEGGLAVGTSFVLKTQLTLTPVQIRQALSFDPAVLYAVRMLPGRGFRLTPRAPLDAGKIYRARLSVLLSGASGLTPRLLTWAFQTRQTSGVAVSSQLARPVRPPPYRIAVKPQTSRIIGGSAVPVHIQASFADGTPVPGGTYRIELRQGSAKPEARNLALDDDGQAEFAVLSRAMVCREAGLACPTTEPLRISVLPAAGADAEPFGQAEVTVYASMHGLEASGQSMHLLGSLADRPAPVSLSVVLPAVLLSTDQPILKLRAMGDALASSTPVTFGVSAPTLGIARATVTTSGSIPISLALDHWPPGDQRLYVDVHTPHVQAQRELHVSVRAPGYTQLALSQHEAQTDMRVPDTPTGDTLIRALSAERGKILAATQALLEPDNDQLETRYVADRARACLRVLGLSVPDVETNWAVYQAPDGGLRPLPEMPSDPDLSAMLAMSEPQMFDQKELSHYLWKIVDAPQTGSETRIAAWSGLGALGELVLPRLQSLARQSDLSWRARFTLASVLLRLGDGERARTLLEQTLASGIEQDGLMSVRVSEAPQDIYAATLQSADLAERLGDARAQALFDYTQTVVPPEGASRLARWSLLRTFWDAASPAAGRIEYQIGRAPASTQNLSYDSHTLVREERFSSDQARNFHVTGVRGSVMLQVVQTVAGHPDRLSSDFGLERGYRVMSGHDLAHLVVGDEVLVSVTSTWSAAAPAGCYALRDHLPAGWRADAVSAAVWTEPGTLGFVVCRQAKSRAVNYRARVLMRGSFTASAPTIQTEQAPFSVASGAEQQVTAP